ncbi:MAG: DUF192 domain-containing protein [Candidatus Falkowbacteria bacterium]|nr:MAG: DUF192 domain-containing protein [Candidatus Falkowbacteria bacterium]
MAFNKKILKFFLFGLLVLVVLIIFVSSQLLPISKIATAEVYLNQHLIQVEIAQTPYQLYRGLSGHPKICADCGMLFIFPDFDERTFVMREMLFPLDIIFIAKGRVVKIYENLAPEGVNPQNLYNSEIPADQVLEINAGQAKVWGVKPGDQLIIK